MIYTCMGCIPNSHAYRVSKLSPWGPPCTSVPCPVGAGGWRWCCVQGGLQGLHWLALCLCTPIMSWKEDFLNVSRNTFPKLKKKETSVTLKKRWTALSLTADSALLWPTRYWRYFSKPSLFFRKHMATSSSVSQSFNFGRNALKAKYSGMH